MGTQLPDYLTPVATVSNVTIEKKSKFITTITPVGSKEEAQQFIAEVASKEVGANHNCYAYIIGNPKSPSHIHCSDDGEPSGTAGKPLLNILQYENLGNTLVVVTRYFGGVKLGSGGLVRAYSGGLKAALEKTVLQPFVREQTIIINFDYQYEATIRHCCETYGVKIVDAIYTSSASFALQLVEEKVSEFSEKLNGITSGKITITEENESG